MPNIDLRGPSKVRIVWERELPRDMSADRPDECDQGFWPSLNSEDAGYIGPKESNETKTQYENRYKRAFRSAQGRMSSWKADHWWYVGVVAKATVYVPIGGNSYAIHQFRSAGLWGIESNAGKYLDEVFEEEKTELLDQLKTMGMALASGEFVDQTDGRSAVDAQA